ncbi:DUF2474 family protein [Vibrio diabolicus]|nr:DUF2474 family protein [Vibrio diabolicus]
MKLKPILWFISIWLASVVALFIVSSLIRAAIL